VDDPIKDSNVALNEIELQSQWDWFNNTFLSRTDAVGGHSKLIVNHTRWSTKDIAGRIQADKDQRDMWYTLLMKVMDEETGEMLCEDILDRSTFYKITGNMNQSIMRANYFQEPLDIQGRLYEQFTEYSDLPDTVVAIRAECDPADTGTDYLCMIVYAETRDKFAYVLDVLYNNQKVEVTMPLMAEMLVEHKTRELVGENNNGGRLLFKILKDHMEKNMHWYRTNIRSEPTTSKMNKESRINNMSSVVQNRIFMPHNWEKRFDTFAKDVYSYISGGKNAHDDAPDCLTRIAERLTEHGGTGAVGKSNMPDKNGKYRVQPVIRVARVIRR
jgi:predicted phage terminase large subunit-like protein